MKKFLLATAAAVAFIAPAQAADLPVRVVQPPAVAPWSWSGLYFGGHIGTGWTTTEWRVVDLGGFGPFSIGSGTVPGFVAGAQIGINYQLGVMVFGAEADFSWANLSGETCNAVAGTLLCNSK